MKQNPLKRAALLAAVVGLTCLGLGLAGALAAGLLAWKKCPVMVCVLGAIGVDLLLYLVV